MRLRMQAPESETLNGVLKAVGFGPASSRRRICSSVQYFCTSSILDPPWLVEVIVDSLTLSDGRTVPAVTHPAFVGDAAGDAEPNDGAAHSSQHEHQNGSLANRMTLTFSSSCSLYSSMSAARSCGSLCSSSPFSTCQSVTS